jgi:hypothetical protein
MISLTQLLFTMIVFVDDDLIDYSSYDVFVVTDKMTNFLPSCDRLSHHILSRYFHASFVSS